MPLASKQISTIESDLLFLAASCKIEELNVLLDRHSTSFESKELNIDYVDEYGRGLLYYSIELVEYLVLKISPNSQDSRGNTPLHYAGGGLFDLDDSESCIASLKILMRAGASLMKNSDAKTPIDTVYIEDLSQRDEAAEIFRAAEDEAIKLSGVALDDEGE